MPSAASASKPPRERASLATMRAIAFLLLLAMVACFLIGRLYEPVHPGFGFLRAFAEAATVGALADWFAVTALFRRPLGLPIPHTAIIPRSKDRIGEGLGRFLESNFLDPGVIDEQLREVDLAGGAAKWLSAPSRRSAVALGLAQAAPRLLELANDAQVERAFQAFALDRLRRADAATLLADVLTVMTAEDRHQPLMERAIEAANKLLAEHEPDIRKRVREETGWLWRLFAVDRKAADALINAVQGAIRDMAQDRDSAWRAQATAAIRNFADELRHSDELRRDIEIAKARLIDHPDLKAYIGALWRELKQEMKTSAEAGVKGLAQRIDAGLGAVARSILEDEPLREALNERLRAWSRMLAQARGDDVAQFVARTIKSWDARTVIDRIEAGVGPDLQYIRISGTVIGGLVGLCLHLVSLAMPG